MDAPRICPAIVGPTAVGKTALITALADRFPLEVISLDSRQIYKGLRIGTAQPTAGELAVCPHHLVDFVPPEETYDATRFRMDFTRVFSEIEARGGRAVLVGGAGLYLTAVREGFMDVPGTSPGRLAAVRDDLDPLEDAEIRRRLSQVDPDSAARIHPNDRYRSQRALEVHLISGRTLSDLQASQTPDPVLGLAFPTFVLERPVEELDARIAARTELMLDGGWLDEVLTLLAKHPAQCPGLTSIGYREIVSYLRAEMPDPRIKETIIRVTRQYAKRQRTWFRHVPREAAGHPDDPDLLSAICDTMISIPTDGGDETT